MATEARRAWGGVAALAAAVCGLLTTGTPVQAASWWQPLAFAGHRVTAVTATTTGIIVSSDGATYVSDDGGRNFRATPATPALASPPLGAGPLVSAGRAWTVRDGVVLSGVDGGTLAPDPGAPRLGAGAHLIAAPAALPGVAAAVGDDGHVWRRRPDGSWATALVLLPAGGLAGVPAITSLAAFTQPVSTAMYVGIDGYGVLLSTDGGDDWVRADAGLPGNVLGLATDGQSKSLYAATADGLWVHHLQAFPAPPVYRDAALYARWLGVAAVALLATTAALLCLRRLLPPADADRR